MGDKRTPKRILEWRPIGTRIRGRPRKRWIVDIEEDMQIMGIRQWRKPCKERAEWKRITEKAKTQWVVLPVEEEEEEEKENPSDLNVNYCPTQYQCLTEDLH
jgi:hypothetical protein